jgi:hypothetical protein
VWWRRFAYFTTLATTLLLLAVFMSPNLLEIMPYNRTALDHGLQPLVNYVVGAIGMFLPKGLESWLEPFNKHPVLMLALVGANGLSLFWGSHLDRRVHDRALRAWNENWRRRAWRSFEVSIRTRYVLGFAVLGLWLTVVWFSGHRALTALAGFGNYGTTVCLAESECFARYLQRLVDFMVFGPLASLSALVVGGIVIWLAMLKRLADQAKAEQREIRGFSLTLANLMLTGRRLDWLSHMVFARAVPAVFAVAVVIGALFGLNRIAFTMLSAGGMVCQPTLNPTELTEQTIDVDFKQACVASKFWVRANNLYEVVVMKDTPAASLRPMVQANVLSWPSDIAKYALFPMRRMLNGDWHSFIVRIGNYGDEHYVFKESTEIKPKASGEIFLFVNDMVVAVPKAYSVLHSRTGTAKLRVRVSKAALPGSPER